MSLYGCIMSKMTYLYYWSIVTGVVCEVLAGAVEVGGKKNEKREKKRSHQGEHQARED